MKSIASVFLLLFIYAQLTAQQVAKSFIQKTQYLFYLPDGYTSDTTKKWPLLVFLHGSGESGEDINKVKMHGPPKLIEAGKKFPFIVVSPQAPPNKGWQTDVLKDLLKDIKKQYRVDDDRVYMTGLSMGGFGTWDYAQKYPNDLAAIAPVCGGGDAAKSWTLRYMPVWCFHGAKDDVVPPRFSQIMVDSLHRYNKNVKFTLYPDANHNSWDATYNNDSLYSWFLSQKKFRFTPITVSSPTLAQYTGNYISPKGDTIKIVKENAKLFVKTSKNETIPLKASSNTNFYWEDEATDEISFNKSKTGVITGFTMLSRERSVFKKAGK